MKKKICPITVMIMIASSLLCAESLHAVDIEVQPRLDAGLMFYSMEINSVSRAKPTQPNTPSGYSYTRDELEYSDTLNFVGCGATLFINRMFVDLSGQFTSESNDRTLVVSSEYFEKYSDEVDTSVFEVLEPEYNGQFSRTDHAVSIGYAVSRRLSLFAGYKWAEVDLDSTFAGPYTLLGVEDWGDPGSLNFMAHGRIKGEEHQTFGYHGPFVGAAHGWPMDRWSFLRGLLSVNAALAHLNSKFKQEVKSTISMDRLNGQPLDTPIETEYRNSNQIKGDSWGLTLGLSWRGETPIQNLSYSLALSGYRYQFESDDSDHSDICETALTFKLGLAYSF